MRSKFLFLCLFLFGMLTACKNTKWVDVPTGTPPEGSVTGKPGETEEPDDPDPTDKTFINCSYIRGDFFETKYYCATYQVTPDKELCDILDSQGQVLLSGLRDVNCVGPGLFFVEEGFSRGLMNDKGEWLYQESIFDGLED